MSKHSYNIVVSVIGFALLLGSAAEAIAQTDPSPVERLAYQLKYDRGQTVQPVFEGWSRNADGTIDMHFGYLNRNYQEELHVPVGPDNRIEPGGPDQGQPTFFHIRSNRNLFTVTVPADFGDQELVWSLTTQGETLRAIGWLAPEWEILEGAVGAGVGGEGGEAANQAPELTVRGSPFSVSLPSELTVTARASDDGKPEPKPEEDDEGPRVGTQDQPPLLTPPEDALEVPRNVPQHRLTVRGNVIRPEPPLGQLTVSYRVWRGPANVTTEPYFAEVENGTATTTISFTEPGEYQLRVSAHDGDLSTEELVSVTVGK